MAARKPTVVKLALVFWLSASNAAAPKVAKKYKGRDQDRYADFTFMIF